MASATTKKTCAKCKKGAGTAMCYGCEKAFCTKHFTEHRQELSQQMDNIDEEHSALGKELTDVQGPHPLLTRINQWEQESITKIQTAAKLARTDLERLLNKAKNNLKTSVSKMKEELQSSRESDDYTELNIMKWSVQLQEFRKMLQCPTTINISYENDARAIVPLIKVTAQQSPDSFQEAIELHELNNRISHRLETPVSERFVDTFGKVTLSKGGLVATCVGGDGDRSCVSGIGQYSSGVHYIRFRVEKIGEVFYSFFGIVNSSEKMTKNIWDSPSCHGWWDLDHRIEGGEMRVDSFTRITRTGDEMTLMLDCDNRRIQLEHHRTHRIVDMFIDLRFCAFPWKMIVSLAGQKDCVRILH
jgi:phage shock protein A